MRSNMSFKTIEQGAATGVFLASNESVLGVSGEYFVNCSIGKPSSIAHDSNLAVNLWENSEKIIARLK